MHMIIFTVSLVHCSVGARAETPGRGCDRTDRPAGREGASAIGWLPGGQSPSVARDLAGLRGAGCSGRASQYEIVPMMSSFPVDAGGAGGGLLINCSVPCTWPVPRAPAKRPLPPVI